MDYNILASGSKGNCTIINNFIAIDMGIPFSQLKPYYKMLKVVFITHQHSDHINKATVKELRSTQTKVNVCSRKVYGSDVV